MTAIRIIRAIFAVFLLGATLFIGATRINQLPPLGPFLDPATGIWSVARTAELPASAAATIKTLGENVRVVYDRRGVPHISASSVDDAIRALGYVVARDRLFQMELQARAAAGTLTEWVGDRAVEADRQQRAVGLAWSAENNYAALDPSSVTARFGLTYAEGVNAWIAGMSAKELPFEYKMLGVKPVRWEAINSVHTFKQLGFTLSFDTHDRWRQGVASLIGREATAALFPVNAPIVEPIQPAGLDRPRFEYRQFPPPPPRERRSANQAIASGPAASSAEWRIGAVGSNNWAVSPSRSSTGHALLSGDPHLGLTLPSIWYEVHITVPGEMDVYGVTIPGIPGIVIGFNRDVAWSFTNTGADVLDYYWETLDHASTPSRYMLDGEWRPLESRVEAYLGQDGDTLAVDTLYFNHRGPVFLSDAGPLSMRWTVLEDAGSMGAFFDAARAKSVAEFGSAMESYFAPAQNMIVADRSGNIAIRSTGHYPIRPGNGNGTEIRDGSFSANDWVGYWPVEDYPGSVNPEQGYLASANQQPLDPQANDRYLGVAWPAPWRAMRINELLRDDSSVTVDAMSRYHTDPGNERAELFVAAFLDAAERVLAVAPEEQLAQAAQLLGEWDRRYTKDNERAVLFEAAMSLLTNGTWDELLSRNTGSRVATPGQSMLAVLLEYPDDPWWDHGSTEDLRETRDDILTSSLLDAMEQVKDDYGLPEDGGWRWDKIRHANIRHILGFPALSVTELPIQGGSGNLNPSSGSGTHGASWRMVVEMGSEVQAWVTYPGGQSGNPVSRWYDNRIPQWVDGSLEQALFPLDPEDLLESDVLSELSLESEGN
jgi:penicillin amidase